MNKYRMIGYVAIIAAAASFAGCADSHQLLRAGNKLTKLDPSKTVYISVPQDGKYDQVHYQGSGVNATQIILLAFSKHSRFIESGHQYQSFDNALAYVKENNYDYLVFPTLLEWEDRATEWSGRPDKASLTISIIDSNSGVTIDSALIKGKSGLATLGGDHPQDLLQQPVEEYVDELYL